MNFLLNAVSSFSLKIFSNLIIYLSSLFYAKTLGAHDYGIFILISSWVTILGIPVGLGTREYIVRETSVLQSSTSNKTLNQLIQWATKTVLKSYLLTILLSLSCAWAFGLFEKDQYFFTYCAALPLILATAQTGIRFAALRGLDKIISSQIPESLLKPSVQLCFAVFVWISFGRVQPWALMASASAGAIAAFFLHYIFINRTLKNDVNTLPIDNAQRKAWLFGTLPFMLITGLFLVNNQINIIMLGSLSSPSNAAIFTVASYGAELISFLLIATNMAIGPTIAKYWHSSQKNEIQRLIRTSIRTVVLIAAPCTAFLIFMSDWLLSWFGPAFLQGSLAMKMLCFGQLFNVCVGSVGLILNMCNKEIFTIVGIGLSSLITFISNWFLIPAFGVNGAAISTVISIVFCNLFWLVALRKTTGFKPSIFEW